MILILGIAGELLSAARTSQLSGQIIANIEERAADAEQKAGEANKEAKRVTKVAEDERVARVQIQEAIAPRRLTLEQRAAISSRLSRFAGQPVAAIHNPFDVEESVIAAEILSALKLAKWNVNPNWGITRTVSSLVRAPSIPVTGIFVEGSPEKRSQLAAKALLQVLSNNGFDCRPPTKSIGGFDRTRSRSEHLVVIDVEARPEGPQGEAKLRSEAEEKRINSNQGKGN
jgi:hypothetical protein